MLYFFSVILGCLGQEGLMKSFLLSFHKYLKRLEPNMNLLLQMCLLNIIELVLFKSGKDLKG